MCLRQDFCAGMLHQHTQLHRVGGIPVRECSLMMFLFHFFLLLVMSNHLTRFGSAVPDRHSRRHERSGCAAEPNWIIVHNICIDKHRDCLRNAFVFTTCFGKTRHSARFTWMMITGTKKSHTLEWKSSSCMMGLQSAEKERNF